MADGPARHVLRGAGWGIGVALGVALGAYLTAVGGTGAPGAQSLDRTELVRLPVLAGLGSFAVVALLSIAASRVSRMLQSRVPDKADD